MRKIIQYTKNYKWLTGVFVSSVAFIYLAFTLLRPFFGIMDLLIIFMWPLVSGPFVARKNKSDINSKRLIIFLSTVSIGSYVLIGVIAGLLKKDIGIEYRWVICGEMMVMYAANLAVSVYGVLCESQKTIQGL